MTALLLTLDGVLYQVRADGPAWRLLALQGKRAGAEYRVTAHGCDCPDAVFRNRADCKHRVSLGLVGLLPGVAEREAVIAGQS